MSRKGASVLWPADCNSCRMIVLILMVFAFVLFVLAMLGIPSPPRFNLMAGGLACWVLALLIQQGSGLIK